LETGNLYWGGRTPKWGVKKKKKKRGWKGWAKGGGTNCSPKFSSNGGESISVGLKRKTGKKQWGKWV